MQKYRFIIESIKTEDEDDGDNRWKRLSKENKRELKKDVDELRKKELFLNLQLF